jgi:glycosyltransferase involved in cell wall biosynthesis
VLFLLGPIGEGYDVHAKIAECGVADRVVVHPPVKPNEVMEFACSADVGLQAQLDDGLNHRYCAPIKLFQYLMAGLPVIASDFPGMLEVVRDNEAGICVDPEDVDAIAAGIVRLLSDEGLWERMAANARRVAVERYCYEKEGARLFARVAELLGAPVEGDA